MDTRDIIEIQQLMALYGHAVDAPDQSMFGQVFTDDAVFDASASGRGPVVGRPAIEALFALGKPPHPPSHHVTNVYIYEADGQTRVRSKWVIVDARNGTMVTGDYDDIVVRTPAGWRLKHRKYFIRYPATFEAQPAKS